MNNDTTTAQTQGAASAGAVSIGRLVQRFWRKASLTWVLVLMEGVCVVAMPLVIGRAVDDLMNESFAGLVELTVLCGVLLLIGAGRRLYDTRAYARIYRTVSCELVAREQQRDAGISKIAARAGLFTELIDFLEESIPSVLQQVINLVGSLAIIALIDVKVFWVCSAAIAFTAVVYTLSERRIFELNAGANSELERQVEVLDSGSEEEIRGHFKRLMDWRIRLSDLETVNFSLIWVALAFLLVFTVAVVTSSGETSFGLIVSTVMYVFGFTESVMILPFYFQQLIRLQEIADRLAIPDGSQGPVGEQQGEI